MPMQHAAAKGNMQLLRLLCKHPPYPGASTRRSASGWAPLHWAAFNANAKAAGVLMEGSSHGRASAMADQNGDTPVHIAAALGHADVLRRLLNGSGQALAQIGSYGWTPVHWAAHAGHKIMLQAMLEKPEGESAAIVPDATGSLPVHLATGSCKVMLLETMRRPGLAARSIPGIPATDLGVPSASGRLQVSDAQHSDQGSRTADEGNEREPWDNVVPQLPSNGILSDQWGRTALHIAASSCDLELMRMLLQMAGGAEALTQATAEGWTPVHVLAQGGLHEAHASHMAGWHPHFPMGPLAATRAAIIRQTLKHQAGRATLAKQDILGRTPTHWAADGGCGATCESLLSVPEGSCALGVWDSRGLTPLLRATLNCKGHLIPSLLQSDAGRAAISSCHPEQGTATHWAARHGACHLIKDVLRWTEGRAALLVQDHMGRTPLHLAAAMQDAEIISTETPYGRCADGQIRNAGVSCHVSWATEQACGGSERPTQTPRACVPASSGCKGRPADLTTPEAPDSIAKPAQEPGVSIQPCSGHGEDQRLSTLRVLLQTSAGQTAINMRDHQGQTPLHAAVEAAQAAALSYLLRFLESLKAIKTGDAAQQTPLHCAAQRGRVEMTDALLALATGKAVLCQPDVDGKCPLHAAAAGAASQSHAEVVKLHLRHPQGRLMLTQQCKQGWTPVHHAANIRGAGSEAMMSGMLGCAEGQRALLQGALGSGPTPVHIAAGQGSACILKLMLTGRSGRHSFLQTEHDGEAPHGIAARRLSDRCLRELINFIRAAEHG